MSEPITTDELLDAAEARMGLLRRQLLTMVAKSAAVRHVATKAEGGERFVLKGGTLLTHVYKSTRQSIGDADYLHLDRETVKTDDIEDALRFKEGQFTMDPQLRFVGERESFEGKGVFSFEDIHIREARDRELKITVSVRPGERLDEPDEPLYYSDPTLTGTSMFKVEGLTINELSAEKLLGWCSKDLAKHLVDLAYVARVWHERVDHDRVAELVHDKFRIEGGARRYKDLGIRATGQLVPRFRDSDRLQTVLYAEWDQLSSDAILFLPAERDQPEDQTLLDPANVARLALEFWEPTLERL